MKIVGEYRSAILIAGLAISLMIIACHPEQTPPASDPSPAFILHGADRTGLNFTNQLTSTKEFNVFHYMYFFNGGGVAVADFNQDGLIDIFFTANMTSNALFLNRGDLRFEDITEAAGLAGQHGWATGACAVDINQDGMMDIYVNQLGDYRTVKGKNQLFVCKSIDENGIPHFADEASQYGLDLVGFGTQAAFFDYDRDGDLDMYQLNHSVHNNGTFGQRRVFLGTYHDLSGDRMLRNDNGKFTDVTKSCGIQSSVIGYGLGIACGDINLDGWPDIYICNDFHENDYLYINQRDGTFREVLTEQMQHTSRFSMGVDVADINNDGFAEVFTLDMHPYDPHILRSSLGEDGYGTFQFKLGYGYNHQYARNNLQFNNRNQTFSDIAVLAGVHATDWSWAALFLDFDHDGYKDLFVSNGIPKRMNDIDYVNFISNNEIQWKINTDNMEDTDLSLEEKLPEIRLPNKFYFNNKNLGFEEIRNILNDQPGFSNGAAYADFDNDGDLDVVVNNIESRPFLYQNMARESGSGDSYLQLHLQGTPQNRDAIGARVIAYRGKDRLLDENFPVVGYQSSVQHGLHLGLGDMTKIDSILLIWPDGTYQRIEKEHCNRASVISWRGGLPVFDFKTLTIPDPQRSEIRDITQATGLDYVHEENEFVEFDREGLIPHMTSAEGPALAIGDANGDGLEDIFIGASKWKHNALFFQNADGTFTKSVQRAMMQDSVHEDVDACFADVDGDGDFDLIVASGGNEFRNKAEALTQRLYRNDGAGVFTRDTTAFQGIYMTAACVSPYDFDGDGDIDLFLGGRAVPWSYGVIPRSYLLANDGMGVFTDVTMEVCPELAQCGLVRDAKWTDLNGDDEMDLIVAVEWGPVQIFEKRGKGFKKTELRGSNGLWNFIDVADFDGDGDLDFVAGNLGRNSELTASIDKPLRLYVHDFDQNGQVEQLLTYFLGDDEIPFATYSEITKQLPEIKKQYLFARDFADASAADLVGDQLNEAKKFEVYVTENSWFENKGRLEFERHALPLRMQFAPLRASFVRDFDNDGNIDLMAMGNFYEANVEMGRYDADYGNILYGGSDGLSKGHLQQLRVLGQVRKINAVKTPNGEIIVVARNNGPVLAFKVSGQDVEL